MQVQGKGAQGLGWAGERMVGCKFKSGGAGVGRGASCPDPSPFPTVQQYHSHQQMFTEHRLHSQEWATKRIKPSKVKNGHSWIKKMWYIYTMEYYLAIKKNNAICSNMDATRDYHTK